jgi:hypothetical protein
MRAIAILLLGAVAIWAVLFLVFEYAFGVSAAWAIGGALLGALGFLAVMLIDSRSGESDS